MKTAPVRWKWVMAVSLAVLVSQLSCGGGGGGDGGGGTPFADTAATYWVSGTGSRWVFQRIDARSGRDASPVLKTVLDTGEAVVAGATVRRFEHSWSLFDDQTETEYRRYDGRSILNVSDLAGEFGVNQPAQVYVELPAPLVDGATTTVADETERVDFDGDGTVDTLQIVARVTVGRTPTLSLPVGEFKDLVQARTVVTGTATDGATGLSASATAVLTAWYAPGIGIVKRVYEDPEFAAPANTITEELVGIDVGGRRAGLLPGLTLLDGIGAGTDSSTPAATGLAVAGDRILSAATKDGAVLASIRDTQGRLVWSGTVLQAPAGSEFGVLAAGFDGSDFRLVAAHRRPYDSPTQTVVVAQRLGADGGLRDGVAGVALQTGIVDTTESIGALRVAAREGRMLVAWGRYDTTYVEIAPGLVTSRGYVTEARLFDSANMPVSPRVEIADGLPAAIGRRDDQFFVVPGPQDGSSGIPVSVRVLSAIDGEPVGAAATVIDSRLLARSQPVLQSVGPEFWLSYGSVDPEFLGSQPPTLTLMRLGRDGALLDGTPENPGLALVRDDFARGSGRVALGNGGHLLTWTEGWDAVMATPFDAAVLAGTTALPVQAMPLVVGDPLRLASPSRGLLWAGAVADGLLVVWLDNAQSAETPSDRISGALWLPRLSTP